MRKTAHALLVGAILHVLYAGKDKSLAGVARLLSDPDRSFEDTLEVMLNTAHRGALGPHPVVASAARELLNKSENERSGVLSTAASFLSLYKDPVVATATSASDFRLIDLVEGEKPVSLYLVVPPSDIARTKPLVRLILNQIGRRLTERLPEAGRRKLLLMLDEFPALGRLDFFESALAFLGGYGVKAFLIAQSLNQIDKAYGQNHAILDNCHVRVAFATNDERTAKRISDSLGTATEQRAQRNYAGHRLSPWLAHVMVSRQDIARPLLTPGEIMQLPSKDEIVMVAGTPPIRARKIRYFEDHNFLERALPAPAAAAGRAETPLPHDWMDAFAAEPRVKPKPKRAAGEKDDRKDDGGGHRKEPDLDPAREPEADDGREEDAEGTLFPKRTDDADGDAPRNAERLRTLTPQQRAYAVDAGIAADPMTGGPA